MKLGLIGVICLVQGLMSPCSAQQKPAVSSPLSSKQIFERFDDSVVKVVTDRATGTGFFVKNGFLIATCYHVIKDASSITIEGTHGAKWSVAAVYFDKDTDAALLKLTADGKRKAIPIGDSHKLEPGDDLSVIGSPLGLTDSLTTGIVSARRLEKGVELIQTTAAVSHGSSGSPVITSEGKVVGFVDGAFEQGELLNLAVTTSTLVKLWAEDPVPVAVFFGAPRPTIFDDLLPGTGKVSTTDGNAAKDKAGKAILANDAFAHWWNSAGRVFLEWDIWWARECDNPNSAEIVIDKAYEYPKELRKALDADHQFTDAMLDFWSLEDIDRYYETLKDLSKSGGDLASAQARAKIVAGSGSAGELEAANKDTEGEHNTTYRLLVRLYEMFRKASWFDSGEFRAQLSAPVAARYFGSRLEGIIPDPVLDEACYVAVGRKGSSLTRGARISTIMRVGSSESFPVANWKELQDYLFKWSSDSEVVVGFDGPDGSGIEKLTVVRP